MIKFVDEEDDGNEAEKDQTRNDVKNTYDVIHTYEVTPQTIFANYKINGGKNNFNNGDYKGELSEAEHSGTETEIIKRLFFTDLWKKLFKNLQNSLSGSRYS